MTLPLAKPASRLWWAVDPTQRDAIGSDEGLRVGDVVFQLSSNEFYRCTGVTGGGSSTWTVVGGGGGAPSGWTDDGAIVRLTTAADTVAIGTAAMAGTEKVRVLDGAVLFDGSTGATPVSGASVRLMWIPAKTALRAGQVSGTDWDDGNIGSASVAFGLNTIASGSQSYAHGFNSDATGTNSHAEGLNALASNTAAYAYGIDCTASGASSHAEGNTCVASATSGYAHGLSCTATLANDRAHGQSCVASGGQAWAHGLSCTASGVSSHAEGLSSVASGDFSGAFGSSCTASGVRSHASGLGTLAEAADSHATGVQTISNRLFGKAHANGRHEFDGDRGSIEFALSAATTDGTATEMTKDGAAPAATTLPTSNRIILEDDHSYEFMIRIVGRDDMRTNHVFAFIEGTALRNGSAASVAVALMNLSTSIIGSGGVAVSADTTNGSIKVDITGLAATNYRWQAWVRLTHVRYDDAGA